MTSGGSCFAKYVVESAFATPGTPSKLFGQGVKISGLELNNNGGLKYGIGNYEAGVSFPGKAGGKFSLEFNPFLDWAWMEACLGGTNGSYSASTLPKSLTVCVGYDLATDIVETYSGVIIKSCKVSIETGDNPVSVSIDCEFAWMTTAETAYSAPSMTDQVWNFGQGAVTVAGTPFTLVERCEITINRNPNMQWGIGSRKAAALWFGQASYELHMVNYLTSPAELLTKVMGATSALSTGVIPEVATVAITLTSGATSVTFSFTNAYPQSLSKTVEVENGVLEDVTLLPRGLSITVDSTA